MTEPRQHVFRHLPGELAPTTNKGTTVEPRTHVFHHPDKTPVLAYREWCRKHLPSSSEGVVIDDVDMTVRLWGPSFQTGPFGKIRFFEIKHGNAWPGIGQMLTFKGIDEIMRRGDPEGLTYGGFFIVRHWTEDWSGDRFEINSRFSLDVPSFKAFLLGEKDIPGYDFTLLKMQTGIQLSRGT